MTATITERDLEKAFENGKAVGFTEAVVIAQRDRLVRHLQTQVDILHKRVAREQRKARPHIEIARRRKRDLAEAQDVVMEQATRLAVMRSQLEVAKADLRTWQDHTLESMRLITDLRNRLALAETVEKGAGDACQDPGPQAACTGSTPPDDQPSE